MEQAILKIVVTGPESSGKTMLTAALAAQWMLPWVPEFARYYVAHMGRPYVQRDLSTIYRGQQIWEQWWLEHSSGSPVLLCDTDWTVLRIWEKYGYGALPSVLPVSDAWENAPNTFYLLCTPDFPWQPDPIREHPEERWPLFDLYQQLLLERHLPHLVLTGTPQERLDAGMRQIQKLLSPLQS